jgi:hypothetical protein
MALVRNAALPAIAEMPVPMALRGLIGCRCFFNTRIVEENGEAVGQAINNHKLRVHTIPVHGILQPHEITMQQFVCAAVNKCRGKATKIAMQWRHIGMRKVAIGAISRSALGKMISVGKSGIFAFQQTIAHAGSTDVAPW